MTAPRRLITVTAVVEVPADYSYDEDAGRAFEGALALVPGTSFGIVTEGLSEAAVAFGAWSAFSMLAHAPVPDGAFLTLDTDGKPPRLHLVWGEPGELAVTFCGQRGIYLDDPNPDYAGASPACQACWSAAAAVTGQGQRRDVPEFLSNVIISERDIGPAHVVCTLCDDTLCWAEDADTFETLTGVALDHYTAKHARAVPGTAFVCGTCGWEAVTAGEEAANLAHAEARPGCPGSPQEDWEAHDADAEDADEREAARTGGTFAGKYLAFAGGAPGTLDSARPGPDQFVRLLAAIAEVGLNEEQDAELSEILGMSLSAIAEVFDLARDMHEAAPGTAP